MTVDRLNTIVIDEKRKKIAQKFELKSIVILQGTNYKELRKQFRGRGTVIYAQKVQLALKTTRLRVNIVLQEISSTKSLKNSIKN